VFSQTATVAFALGILVLFVLDRDRKVRTSLALWIPVVWLWIGGSRTVSQWLQMAPTTLSADQILEGSPLDRNIVMGLTAVGVCVLLRRGQRVATLLRAHGAILLFFLYCGASVIWSDYPLVAFKRWIKACGDLVMVLIVLTDPDPSAAVKRLLARLGFLLIPPSILIIKYYPELGRGYENFTWAPVFTGVTLGKNLLGMICMICGLGAVWRLLHGVREGADTRGRGPLIAQSCLLGMALWLFWYARSMTALLCFLLATVLIAATRLHAVVRTPSLVHLVVAAVLSLSVSIVFLDFGSSALGTFGRDETLTGRTELWRAVLAVPNDVLFGSGFESFWLGERLEYFWSRYWWRPNEAHNGYLEIFLNLGWTGVALFGLVLVSGYRKVVNALQRDPAHGSFRLAFFVAMVVYNLTEAAVRGFQPLWILFLLTMMDAPRSRKVASSAAWRYRHADRSVGQLAPSERLLTRRSLTRPPEGIATP